MAKARRFLFFDAFLLVRRGGAERGIEGDIVFLFTRGTRFDVTSVFALGLGERTPSRLFAREFIERRV